MNDFPRLKARFRAGETSKPDYVREAFALHQALFDYVEVTRTTDVREIRVDAQGVRFVVGDDGIVLHCPAGEARVAPIEVMNFDRYEPEETAVMDRMVRGCDVVLDIGANIGWYTARLAKRLPEARIYAFEPMPTSFAFLQRNVVANGVGARVSTFNYGLSDSAGAVQFFISPAAGTNASLKNVAGAGDAVPITGLTLTLDQWVANHGVAPQFIKCDVEGAELLVFRGGEATLRAHRPVVFTELLRKWSRPFGYHPNDMLAFFAALGYRCLAVGQAGAHVITTVTDETVETNYAFLHAQDHAALIQELGKAIVTSPTDIDSGALAREIRSQALRMVHRARASHIGSALSIADIVAVLYAGVLHVDAATPRDPTRDRFILSKGHACVAVYAALAARGFFDREQLQQYGRDHSDLMNHISHKVPGVEMSTGSLGHGLPFGVGKALAARRLAATWRTFVLMSDGEWGEGSNWEAALFASHHGLDNLVAIIDYNKLQSLTSVAETLALEPLAAKFEAFGWAVREVDGHDHDALRRDLAAKPWHPGKPSMLIAHTTKGKGVSFMENQVKWHYSPPSDVELQRALGEVGAEGLA